MNYHRILEHKLAEHFKYNKQAIILLGARQIGKTTLLRRVFPDALYLLADEDPIAQTLETYSSKKYQSYIRGHKQVIIDEIHLISNPGRAVKILYDQFPGIQLIITGSSSLHIKNKTAESMAGRAFDYFLYPLTFWEMLFQLEVETEHKPHYIIDKIQTGDLTPTPHLFNTLDFLTPTLTYGLYPEIINRHQKEEYLLNLTSKAIFKDIVELNLIENREKAMELLQVLAYQIGNIISYSEISRKLGLSIPTVQRYIDIFEQSFLLYRLYPFSKNKRDEIGRAPKIYFWDVGLRNALITDFQKPQLRNDLGALFENFIISEIKKEISYKGLYYRVNYWRTKSGSEVDLVLSDPNELIGVEIKYSRGSVTQAFTNRYPEAKTMVINSENFY